MIKLFDRVKVNIPTTGTGDIEFGAAASTAFLTPTEAGVLDGDEVRYFINDGLDFEEGVGLIKDTVTTMERTVTKSKIGGVVGTSPINLSGTAVLALSASAADIGNVVGPSGATDGHLVVFDGATGKLIKSSGKTVDEVGTGDVVGPSSATNGNLVTFDGATGKLVKDSGTSVASINSRLDYLVTPPAAKTQLPTLIPLWEAGYTKIGNMTQGSGLAGLFDQSITTRSWKETSNAFCGIDFGSAIALYKWEVQGAFNGFDGSAGVNDVALKLYGSNSPFTNGNEGTLLHDTGVFNDPNDPSIVTLNADPDTAYRYYSVYFSTYVWCSASGVRAYRVPQSIKFDAPRGTIIRSVPCEISLQQAGPEVLAFRTRFEIVEPGAIDVALRIEAKHLGVLFLPQYTDVLGFGTYLHYRYAALESDLESATWLFVDNAMSGQNIVSPTDHYGTNIPSFSLNVVPGFYEVRVASGAHTDADTRNGLACLNEAVPYNEFRISYTQGGFVVRS